MNMKLNTSMSTSFDRPKLLLFRFLAHQIHPFAYAVNTFLQPALDDCRALLHSNPQDTFNILLSLTQTFIRFAPDSELIYDDIQQFAAKLKNSIDECFTWLDADTIQQSAEVIETIHQSLLAIINQQNNDNTNYTNLYKNMSAVLTNLQKINSLPVEVQSFSLNHTLEKTIPIEQICKSEPTTMNTSQESKKQNGHNSTLIEKPTACLIPPPPGFPSLPQNPTSPPTATSVTNKLMNQMKNLSVSSIPSNPTLTSAIESTSRAMSSTSYLNDYEITETVTTTKSPGKIASFPPRPSSIMDDHNVETPISMNSNEGGIRFGTTPAPAITPIAHDDSWDDERSRQYYLDPRFSDPIAASADWQPARGHLSVLIEQSHLNHTTAITYSHITDEYLQEYGNKSNRPSLRGDLWMTYGTPQTGPQSTCLPIGVALTYDESTLLSCDVHRNSQNVRLFDVQSGQLKHTISSTPQMKFHRPSAVMSSPRNEILIVERDYIYATEPDGRLIQAIGHRSIKQLYGIALFRDRYLLTIDSKATDQTAENSRLLLFDPNSNQLVFEQRIVINRESEEILKQQNINHIQGKILPETTSKPRFLAVYNDKIYIADLGRSLIYGTTIRNQFEFSCTTVFGGQGRNHGEMTDPSGLFIDSGGNIISADSKNDRIQIFSSEGDYRTSLKLNERIKRPSGICTNRAGTQFYISCYLAGCVRAFNINY